LDICTPPERPPVHSAEQQTAEVITGFGNNIARPDSQFPRMDIGSWGLTRGLNYGFAFAARRKKFSPESEDCTKLSQGTGIVMPEVVDPIYSEPQHEAAFFYGLFIRGVPLQKLRADIDVSPEVLERWQRQAVHDPWYQLAVGRVLAYRKNVLAIFDSLVIQVLEPPTQRIQ
jgi:hypothetical protein